MDCRVAIRDESVNANRPVDGFAVAREERARASDDVISARTFSPPNG